MSGSRNYQKLVASLDSKTEDDLFGGSQITGLNEEKKPRPENKENPTVAVQNKARKGRRVAPAQEEKQDQESEYKNWVQLFKNNSEFKSLAQEKDSAINLIRAALRKRFEQNKDVEDSEIDLAFCDLTVELQLMRIAITINNPAFKKDVKINNQNVNIYNETFTQFKEFIDCYLQEKNQGRYLLGVKNFFERVKKIEYASTVRHERYLELVYVLSSPTTPKAKLGTFHIDWFTIDDLEKIGPSLFHLNSLFFIQKNKYQQDEVMFFLVACTNPVQVKLYFKLAWELIIKRLKDVIEPNDKLEHDFIADQTKKYEEFFKQKNPDPVELVLFLQSILYVSRAYVGLSLLKDDLAEQKRSDPGLVSLKEKLKKEIYDQSKNEVKKILQSDALTYQEVASRAILNAAHAFEETNQETLDAMIESANFLAHLDHHLAPWFMIGAGVLLMALGYGLGANTFGLSAYFATKYAMPLVIAGLSSFSIGATIKTFQLFRPSLARSISKAEHVLQPPRN